MRDGSMPLLFQLHFNSRKPAMAKPREHISPKLCSCIVENGPLSSYHMMTLELVYVPYSYLEPLGM